MAATATPGDPGPSDLAAVPGVLGGAARNRRHRGEGRQAGRGARPQEPAGEPAGLAATPTTRRDRAASRRAAVSRGDDTFTFPYDEEGDDPGVDQDSSVGTEAVDGAAAAPRRRKVGEPVRLPVPITTRAWAFLRLALFVATLGLVIGGTLVFIVVTLASSLLG
jgi:hypothetical protein